MRYLGSKARIKKYIIPFLMEHLNGENTFFDSFMGGANIIDSVDYPKKVGIEYSKYSYAVWDRIQKEGINWLPNEGFTEEDYYDVKSDWKNKTKFYDDAYIGYVANSLSFGSKFFGGFAKFNPKKNENHVKEAYNGIKRQYENFKYLSTTKFINCSYDDYNYPPNSVIYCDIPYQSCVGYESSFDHEKFWQWVRDMTNQGHYVYVSEYNAPSDMTCIWRKSIKEQVGKNINQKVEKLFIYNPKK